MPQIQGSYPAKLDTQVYIQARNVTRGELGGKPAAWTTFATEWADIEEATSSRAPDERTEGEANLYGRPTTVKMHWRGDVTAAHRLVEVESGRVMQIMGTAEVGRRRWLALAVREWSHE